MKGNISNTYRMKLLSRDNNTEKVIVEVLSSPFRGLSVNQRIELSVGDYRRIRDAPAKVGDEFGYKHSELEKVIRTYRPNVLNSFFDLRPGVKSATKPLDEDSALEIIMGDVETDPDKA